MIGKNLQKMTFVSSMGLAIDLGATRSASRLGEIIDDFGSVHIFSDEEAIRTDWEAVGDDILSAMNTFAKENEQLKK
jgi:hypothetical protein